MTESLGPRVPTAESLRLATPTVSHLYKYVIYEVCMGQPHPGESTPMVELVEAP